VPKGVGPVGQRRGRLRRRKGGEAGVFPDAAVHAVGDRTTALTSE
jgi:hypothetical protein